VAVAAAVAALLSACSGGGSKSTASPTDLLAQAKQTLDAASAVHVEVAGSDFPSGKNVLTKASGDAAHPDKFKGDLSVKLNGFDVSIPVVSVSGKFYAEVPGAGGYTAVDPSQYGVSDPSKLISTSDGLSGLLTATANPTSAGQTRQGDEVLDKITGTLPGALVGSLLTIADPSATVNVTYAINSKSKQLRWAELKGPFYAKGTTTTYRVTLTDYGKTVDITAPASG
jgi:lipoprotein LprG